MSDIERLYQETILEHHRHPHNAVRVPEATHSAEGHNPLCGDRVTVTARVAGPVLEAVGCEARGCALCRASGSMMTDALVGRQLSEIPRLVSRFLALLDTPTKSVCDPPPADLTFPAELEPLTALSEVRHFPSRIRCATLSWETLRRALSP
jgi:nitrogen fixation NifU-like protein